MLLLSRRLHQITSKFFKAFEYRHHCLRNFSHIVSPSSSPAKTKNALESFIVDRIRTSGPITVAEYMKLCVSSQYGYYAQKGKIFGEEGGDFVTSPELAQVFGELVGAWVLNELHMTGWKGEWNLVELGPGSGALLVDVLGVMDKLQADTSLETVHLVEKSPKLIEHQKQTLAKHLLFEEHNFQWHDSIEDIPDGFTVFITNEFFDALPIHQFVRSEHDPNVWHEVYVQLNNDFAENCAEEEGVEGNEKINRQQRLCFGLSPGENIHTRSLIPEHIRQNFTRRKWECSPLTVQIVQHIVKRFTTNGGFALIVDYGHSGERETHSLRAYKAHTIVNPLESPGQVDLTADVDFGALKRSIEGNCLAFGPVEQRRFLSELGLGLRLDYLLRKSETKEQREALLSSCNVLVSDAEMGERFKAMALFPSTLEGILDARGGVPAGFASSLPTSATSKKISEEIEEEEK